MNVYLGGGIGGDSNGAFSGNLLVQHVKQYIIYKRRVCWGKDLDGEMMINEILVGIYWINFMGIYNTIRRTATYDGGWVF